MDDFGVDALPDVADFEQAPSIRATANKADADNTKERDIERFSKRLIKGALGENHMKHIDPRQRELSTW